MKWGLNKLKTLPTQEVDDFLMHIIERNNVEEAIESSKILTEKYKLTKEINVEEQNESLMFVEKLEHTHLVKINLETLIKEY